MRFCNCNTVYGLGCADHCGDISMPMLARLSGTHTLKWWFAGSLQVNTFEATAATPLIIPNFFNESASIVFQIIEPGGSLYEHQNHTCFRIQLVPVF